MISTACARLKDGFAGDAGIWIINEHSADSSFFSPLVFPSERAGLCDCFRKLPDSSCRLSYRYIYPRFFPILLVAPMITDLSAIAAFNSGKTLISARTSSAPCANHPASSEGNFPGRTSSSLENPRFFSARAEAPMLPGSIVSTSMKCNVVFPFVHSG